MIITRKFITRDYVRENSEYGFIFGDNVERKGLGGQAYHMRGEPNSFGVATKWSPGAGDDDYFKDHEFRAWMVIDRDLFTIELEMFGEGKTFILPEDGIGTGLSDMPNRCPKLFAYMMNRINSWPRHK